MHAGETHASRMRTMFIDMNVLLSRAAGMPGSVGRRAMAGVLTRWASEDGMARLPEDMDAMGLDWHLKDGWNRKHLESAMAERNMHQVNGLLGKLFEAAKDLGEKSHP